MSLAEGYEDDEDTGAPQLWGKAEGSGPARPREETPERGPHQCLSIWREVPSMHKCRCSHQDLSGQYVLHLPHTSCSNYLVLWEGFWRISIVSSGEKDVDGSSVVEWLQCLLVLRASLMTPVLIHPRDFNLHVLDCTWMFCPSVVSSISVPFMYRYFWGRYFYFFSVVTTMTENLS